MKNTYLFQFFAHVNITSPDWLPVVFVDRLPSCAHGVTGRKKAREREDLLFSFPFHHSFSRRTHHKNDCDKSLGRESTRRIAPSWV